jgi:hypothetical protein
MVLAPAVRLGWEQPNISSYDKSVVTEEQIHARAPVFPLRTSDRVYLCKGMAHRL